MYKFIDVNEASEGVVLPSEAMMLNGEYIENLIPGYRTLTVQGREALSPVIDEYESGVRDGSFINSRRYPSRIIIVKYQLVAKSNEEFREAYNKLGGILNVDDAQLIFNDEPDKYFTGTPYAIGDVDPGRNSVVGEFSILCNDPFKYSVTEYEASIADGEEGVYFEYKGTHKAFPKLEAEFYDETDNAGALTGAGDCGYVAFFNDNSKVIQLGDPGEIDGENKYAKSQTLVNQTLKTLSAWEGTAQGLWAMNNGKVLPYDVEQMGTVAMGEATTATIVKTTTTSSGKETEVANTATSGTLLNFASGKYCRWSLKYAVYNRTKDKVSIKFTIEAMNHTAISVGHTMTATLYFKSCGLTKSVTIKASTGVWNNSSKVTCVYADIPVSSVQASLSSVQFSATEKRISTGKSTTEISKALPTFAIPAFEQRATSSTTTTTSYTTVGETTHYLTVSDYGNADKWHGPSITRTIGADEKGNKGAKDFTLTYEQKMCIGTKDYSPNELGGFHCHLWTADGKPVCGVRVVKSERGSRYGSIQYWVNAQKVHQIGVDLANNNPNFSSNASAKRTTTIKKVGNKVTFTVGDQQAYTFTDDAIANLVTEKLTFAFEQYSTNGPLAYNGLYWAKFVKDNCDTWLNAPNTFSANDVLVADCKNAEIMLNGKPAPSLGELGNDWEGFYLKPGFNQIGAAWSEWVPDKCRPQIRIKYREVFL